VIAKHGFACSVNSSAELVAVSSEHELEELGNGLGVLLDLLLRIGIHDGKTGVHVPLV
jgi:hypothetical protein